MADDLPVMVWWSREGAEAGTQWRIRQSDGSFDLASVVRIKGTVALLPPPANLSLPDGPRGVLMLLDGELLAGK